MDALRMRWYGGMSHAGFASTCWMRLRIARSKEVMSEHRDYPMALLQLIPPSYGDASERRADKKNIVVGGVTFSLPAMREDVQVEVVFTSSPLEQGM